MTLKNFFFAAAFVMTAFPAFALDLQSARNAGSLGEKRDGYVEAISGSLEVKALAADINARRKEEYKRISAQNGQTVDVVAKLAAPTIIAKLPAGAMYQDESGNWKKK